MPNNLFFNLLEEEQTKDWIHYGLILYTCITFNEVIWHRNIFVLLNQYYSTICLWNLWFANFANNDGKKSFACSLLTISMVRCRIQGCHLAFLNQFSRNKMLWPFMSLKEKVILSQFWLNFRKTYNILWNSRIFLMYFELILHLIIWPFWNCLWSNLAFLFWKPGTWQPCSN